MRLIRIPLRLVFLLLIIFSGVILAILFLRHTMSPAGLAATITRNWHRQVCHAFNIDVVVIGDMPKQPSLLVCNHISWFDITAIGSVISARYLSKYEVVDWPVVGWLAIKTGTLFIKRGAGQAASHSMQSMAQALKQGDHVVLFPEGTTTDGIDIRRFHARLFQSAIDSDALIQPVAIRYPHSNGVNVARGQVH